MNTHHKRLMSAILVFGVMLFASCTQSDSKFLSGKPNDISSVGDPVNAPTEVNAIKTANLPEGPDLILNNNEVFSTEVEMSLKRVHKITMAMDATIASIEGPINITEDATDLIIDVPTGMTLTLNGNIQSKAGVKLQKIGGGTLVLGGSNSIPNGIQLLAGAIQIAQASNLGNGPLEIYQGSLNVTGNTILSQPISLATQNVFFTVVPGKMLTLAGQISGVGGYVVMGGGLLKLANSIANTYKGVTYISDATLILASTSYKGAIVGDGVANGDCSEPDIVVQPGGLLSWADGEQLARTVSVLIQSMGTVHGSGQYWTGPRTTESYYDICNIGGTWNTGRYVNLTIIN